MPKKYTDEFKRDVVALAQQEGATQRQIAKDFGVSKTALWPCPRFVDTGLCGLLKFRGLV